MDKAFEQFLDPITILSILVAVAVFATLFTLLPAFGGNPVKQRMKSVALERDALRAQQRARLAAEADRRRRGLREQQPAGIRSIVEKLDLRRLLADENTAGKLKEAGFRGQNPLNTFLFFRLVMPFVFFAFALVYLFLMGGLPEQPFFVRLFVSVVAAYAGFYAPVVYVSNRAQKRRSSIERAFPDALDLMLICVESGMSVEAAFKRVSEEIGAQSVDLAEEFVLTNAELSFLQERRQAFENLAQRTGLESVKAVAQALIQAERYGTPVAQALRVLSAESREMRMNAAEKKAAALPPKLTVPMILFFLPVLFVVILGPAGITVSERGIFSQAKGNTSN